jgi:hypothetical protein
LHADAALQRDLTVAHEGYVEQTLAAGRLLDTLAGQYGFDLRGGPDVRE